MAIARRTSRSLSAFARCNLVRVVGVDEDREVEVAVADVADDRREQPGRVEVAPWSRRCISASAEIGTQASVVKPLRAGPQRAAGLVGAVAGVPERAALGLVGGPVEAEDAVAVGDLARRPSACAAVSAGVPWNSRKSVGRDRRGRARSGG